MLDEDGPRCSVPGCSRRVNGRGLCRGHGEDPNRTIRVLRAKGDRVLAWGRLIVDRSSVPVLAAEAKRRGLGPSALMADIIDRWCKALTNGGWPRNSLAPCAYPGCDRPLYQGALCRSHYEQRRRGKELTPIRPYGPGNEVGDAFGHLRLTPELSKWLRRTGASRSMAVADAACAGVAAADRETSPFSHLEDLDGARPFRGPHSSRPSLQPTLGVTMFVRPVPGLTQERLQRLVNCHLAQTAVLGHVSPGEPACPLVPAGVTATVRSAQDRFAVDLKGSSPEVVKEIEVGRGAWSATAGRTETRSGEALGPGAPT